MIGKFRPKDMEFLRETLDTSSFITKYQMEMFCSGIRSRDEDAVLAVLITLDPNIPNLNSNQCPPRSWDKHEMMAEITRV